MYNITRILLSIFLAASIFSAQSFAGKGDIGRADHTLAVSAALLAAKIVGDAVNMATKAIAALSVSVPEADLTVAPAAQAIDTNLHLAATEHGGDGWCGYNSLAAALEMSVAQMLSQTIDYLTHMTAAQTAQVQNLLSLQQIAGHQQYQGIETVTQLISQLQTLQGLAASGEALPVIHFWFDGFLAQIFEAALQVHIVIVQPVSDEASSGPNILPHPVTNTHYAFNHHIGDTPLFQPNGATPPPVVTLVFGGNSGNLLAHYQLLSINGHTTQTQGAFYDWLQQLICGLDHVAGSSQNWQLTGTPWIDVLEDQEAYWQNQFRKRVLGYYKTANIGVENGVERKPKVIFSEKEAACLLFQLFENKFMHHSEGVTLDNFFTEFPGSEQYKAELVEHLKYRKETLEECKKCIDYFYQLKRFYSRNEDLQRIFRNLLMLVAVSETNYEKRSTCLYLDTMPNVGCILRTKKTILKNEVIGPYTGDLFVTLRYDREITTDMYLVEFHPLCVEYFKANYFTVLSAKRNGNEYRFMSSTDLYSANTLFKQTWIKTEKGYRLDVQVCAIQNIDAGQQLVSHFGDEFQEMIRLETGREPVEFCHCCKEALGGKQVTWSMKILKLSYCSRKCLDNDDENRKMSLHIARSKAKKPGSRLLDELKNPQ